MTGSIDRISENYFVVLLENKCVINLWKDDYPDLHVGDIIEINEEGIFVNREETEKIKEENIYLQESLFK